MFVFQQKRYLDQHSMTLLALNDRLFLIFFSPGSYINLLIICFLIRIKSNARIFKNYNKIYLFYVLLTI